MIQKKPLTINCPNCQAEVIWSDDYPYRPFCSKRCQEADFCSWANEEKCLPGETETDDLMSDDLYERPPNLS